MQEEPGVFWMEGGEAPPDSSGRPLDGPGWVAPEPWIHATLGDRASSGTAQLNRVSGCSSWGRSRPSGELESRSRLGMAGGLVSLPGLAAELPQCPRVATGGSAGGCAPGERRLGLQGRGRGQHPPTAPVRRGRAVTTEDSLADICTPAIVPRKASFSPPLQEEAGGSLKAVHSQGPSLWVPAPSQPPQRPDRPPLGTPTGLPAPLGGGHWPSPGTGTA